MELHPTLHILFLKKQLEESDYKVNKFVEGWLTEEEFAPIRAERQKIREEINRLEDFLAQQGGAQND